MQVQRSRSHPDCWRVEGDEEQTLAVEAREIGKIRKRHIHAVSSIRRNPDGAHWLRRKAASSPFSFFCCRHHPSFYHSTTPHATTIIRTLHIHINHTSLYNKSNPHNPQWPKERARTALKRVNHRCLLFWARHHHRVARIVLRGVGGMYSLHIAREAYRRSCNASQLFAPALKIPPARFLQSTHPANLLCRRHQEGCEFVQDTMRTMPQPESR